jgi:hypothetical protein
MLDNLAGAAMHRDILIYRLPRRLRVTPAEFYHIDKTINGFMNPNYAQISTAWRIPAFSQSVNLQAGQKLEI